MFTLAQAAVLFDLAPSTLRHQVANGRLRAELIGRTYVVTSEEVTRYRAESLGKRGRPAGAKDSKPQSGHRNWSRVKAERAARKAVGSGQATGGSPGGRVQPGRAR